MARAERGQRRALRPSPLLTASLAVGLAVTATGCADDECSGDAPATVSAFVPQGAPVHCVDAKTFAFERRGVRLTHVEYGAKLDCSSGCFSSHVCAIEDPPAQPALFYATWTSPTERPLGLEAECPQGTTFPPGETWPNCVPSGLRHPLVATDDFRNFANDEEGSGPFRYCVNRYVLDGDWP